MRSDWQLEYAFHDSSNPIAKEFIPSSTTDNIVMTQGSSGEREQLLCSECKVPCPRCEETIAASVLHSQYRVHS